MFSCFLAPSQPIKSKQMQTRGNLKDITSTSTPNRWFLEAFKYPKPPETTCWGVQVDIPAALSSLWQIDGDQFRKTSPNWPWKRCFSEENKTRLKVASSSKNERSNGDLPPKNHTRPYGTKIAHTLKSRSLTSHISENSTTNSAVLAP